MPALPREHGAWAWLLLPLIVGGATSSRFSPPVVLFPTAVLLAYLGRGPAEAWLRRRRGADLAWAAVLAVVASGFGAPAVILWQRWMLLPAAALVAGGPLLVATSRALKTTRRTAGELLVVTSLAALAPAVRFAAEGDLAATHLLVWLPVALYGGASVFFVRMLFHGRRRSNRLGDPAVAYHAALTLALAAVAVAGLVPPLAPLAFLPLLVKVGLALAHPPARVRPTRVGLLESAHAAAFAGLLVAAYRVA